MYIYIIIYIVYIYCMSLYIYNVYSLGMPVYLKTFTIQRNICMYSCVSHNFISNYLYDMRLLDHPLTWNQVETIGFQFFIWNEAYNFGAVS